MAMHILRLVNSTGSTPVRLLGNSKHNHKFHFGTELILLLHTSDLIYRD